MGKTQPALLRFARGRVSGAGGGISSRKNCVSSQKKSRVGGGAGDGPGIVSGCGGSRARRAGNRALKKSAEGTLYRHQLSAKTKAQPKSGCAQLSCDSFPEEKLCAPQLKQDPCQHRMNVGVVPEIRKHQSRRLYR